MSPLEAENPSQFGRLAVPFVEKHVASSMKIRGFSQSFVVRPGPVLAEAGVAASCCGESSAVLATLLLLIPVIPKTSLFFPVVVRNEGLVGIRLASGTFFFFPLFFVLLLSLFFSFSFFSSFPSLFPCRAVVVYSLVSARFYLPCAGVVSAALLTSTLISSALAAVSFLVNQAAPPAGNAR